MDALEKAISQMDFHYFGTGQHKIKVADFFEREDAVLLDVRTAEEVATMRLGLAHHCPVLEIPVNKVPARINEIPRDKLIGVFCSSSVRCVIIFAYLKSRGYERVKVLPGGYHDFTDALLPGKVWAKMQGKK